MKNILNIMLILFSFSIHANVNISSDAFCNVDTSASDNISIVEATGVAVNRKGFVQTRSELKNEDLMALSKVERKCFSDTENSELTSTEKDNKVDLKKGLSHQVNFDFDRSDINDKAQIILNEFASELKASNKQLILTGHTDNIGSESYNIELGYRRSNSVRQYLAGKGIDKKRAAIHSQGLQKPIKSNLNKEGRAANRRVEINMY